MPFSRDRSSTRLLCTILIVAFLAGLSMCAVDTLVDRTDHHEQEHGHHSPVAHTSPGEADHHGTDADNDTCCTVFGAALGSVVRPEMTRIEGPGIDAATLPRVQVAVIVVTASVIVPRTRPERFSSRSSPPASLRGPPLSLLG